MTNLLSPFKWSGSKRSELKKIRAIIGNESYSVVEPFMGTGIVSGTFGLNGKCLGNDLNHRILLMFKYSSNPLFYSMCKELLRQENYTHDKFYEIRTAYNEMEDKESLAATAHLFYLQNLSHFGLYRIGKGGKYTSTYHFLEKPLKFEERYESLKIIANKFQHLTSLDYRLFLENYESEIKQCNLMFIDPPYINASYSDYSVGGDAFTVNDLHFLDDYCNFLLTKHKINCIICNYSTDNDTEIYGNATRFIEFSTMRQMNLQNTKDRNFKKSVYAIYGDFKTSETITYL